MKNARLPTTQQGLALVEFAITLTVLLVLVFGITEFGRAIFQYNTLAKSARDAARYLTMQTPGNDKAIDAAKCMAVYGTPLCKDGDWPLAPGLEEAMVSVCDKVKCPGTHQGVEDPDGTVTMNLVTVTIGGGKKPYRFTSMFEFVVPSFDFGPISVTMRTL